jgi:hypothetical protein
MIPRPALPVLVAVRDIEERGENLNLLSDKSRRLKAIVSIQTRFSAADHTFSPSVVDFKTALDIRMPAITLSFSLIDRRLPNPSIDIFCVRDRFQMCGIHAQFISAQMI